MGGRRPEPRQRAGGSPRGTDAPSRSKGERPQAGTVFREGVTGITIVAAAAAVVTFLAGLLAVLIALLY